jgi:integration host factor subunit alpha
MPITESDLINDTVISCGVSRDYARVAIEQFFDVVKDSIKAGNSLEIRGFGTFSPKTCNPRKGRNMQTGELIPLASRKSITFKFSSELKGRITGSAAKGQRPARVAATEQVQARGLAKID